MATQTPVLGLTKPELTDEIPATILALAANADKIEGAIESGVQAFTPYLIGTAGNPSVTYSEQDGRWARVGPLVIVYIRVDWTSFTGGAGNLRIGGMEGAPAAFASRPFIVGGRTTGLVYPTDRPNFYASIVGSQWVLSAFGSAATSAAITVGSASSSGSVILTGCYLTGQ